ncbi:prepilin-type N-terminal cleavage/methylation domain-containing protein [Cyanobium sp. ATX 6A2]|uniref:prepilin-type N-terminal cleavage/methylation domain-containing protein n=1 Tax=Cyanobium sp. ATX 6A2 TaxID=2823700 RepID=UPI0037C1890F|nr:prepilin-type N-terminal cleavage/methylation domain-containing protein [Cyanobium sp. ATX 6A2]
METHKLVNSSIRNSLDVICSRQGTTCCSGFTLLEVIVSAVILVVATLGSITAFNLATRSIRGTGLFVEQNREIDRDISEISRLSEIYTACVPGSGSGSIPANPNTACTDTLSGLVVAPNSSFYYFPDPANASDVAAFETSCGSSTPTSHITFGFRSAIDSLDQPGAGITRQNATRVDGSDAGNHLVEILWVDSSDGDELRRMRLSPLVTAWCP